MSDSSRKIAPYTVLDMGKVRIAARQNPRIDLFDVFGIITDRSRKPTEYGQSITYLGRFEAVLLDKQFALPDAVPGEVIKGDRAFFPPELEVLIDAAFPAKGRANIQLGARIGIGPLPEGVKNLTGFVWVVEPLVKPSESSAVSMLREQYAQGHQ